MNKIIIADTETTGLIDPIQPTELAWLSLNWETLEVKEKFLSRYKPSKPIELGAKMTAHILEEDLVNEPDWSQAVLDLPIELEYIIGHNIDYDWKVLNKPSVRRICTKALASGIYEGLDSYSQSALMYYLFGASARPWLKEAHTALQDVENNLRLLRMLLAAYTEKLQPESKLSIEDLWEISEEARVPKVVPFGKFKGKPFTAMDRGYVSWWRTASDTKPDFYAEIALARAGF